LARQWGTEPLRSPVPIWLARRIRTAARQKRERESRIHSHVHQAFSGIEVVQAYAQEEREQSRLTRLADAAIEQVMDTAVFRPEVILFQFTPGEVGDHQHLYLHDDDVGQNAVVEDVDDG